MCRILRLPELLGGDGHVGGDEGQLPGTEVELKEGANRGWRKEGKGEEDDVLITAEGGWRSRREAAGVTRGGVQNCFSPGYAH